MQRQSNKNYHHIRLSIAAYIARHRFLFISFITVLIIYVIIRTFFTPALLSGIPFGNAYYDRNGTLLRVTLSSDDKYRLYTPLSEISPYIKQATILYEDKHFYHHIGINPISLARATVGYISGRPHPAGASTITMQVARIKYNLNTTQPSGKLIQIMAAIYIDLFYSKDDILDAYLNLAPYGGNLEGINAASLIYFNKPASELTKIESITLATIPQNPSKRGLNTDTGLNNIKNMRGDLIRRWINQYPDDKNLITFANMPLSVHRATDLPMRAPHFTDRMQSRQTSYWTAPTAPVSSYVQTTLNWDLQQHLERRLRAEINARKSRGIENASAILLNYKTMDVLAHIGSADYFDNSIFGQNDGVYARRSPGSTLKPLIYAAATDSGLIHGMTLLKDAKINFGVYAPENADNEFFGPVLAHDALTHSRNIPAIHLIQKLGFRNFYKLLSDSGVTNLRSPGYYGISIALGGAEVSMQELADIYATMANLGMRYNIRTNLSDDKGTGTQLLSPEAFFITLDMLSRQNAPTPNIPFAKKQIQPLKHYWKTGTSSSFRDAWTAGIFGDFVLIVWVGNFDGHPNNAFSGARTAAPIYFALSDTVREYYSAHNTPISDNNFWRSDLNISQIDMCADVGGIANEYCPKTIKAYFIPGKSPIDTSSVYRAIPIDNKTGLRACSNNPDTTHMSVYEFWDAEYLDMFTRAGIKRKTPPPFMPGCDLDNISQTTNAPIITTPIDNARIIITDASDTATVSFQALTESPSEHIIWFLDDDIIGTTHSGAVITHPVNMGNHIIYATTESGTSTNIQFSVVK